MAYLLFGLLWMVACTLHSEELIKLQYLITGGLALGMIETALIYSHFHTWNELGTISVGLFSSGEGKIGHVMQTRPDQTMALIRPYCLLLMLIIELFYIFVCSNGDVRSNCRRDQESCLSSSGVGAYLME